jgi:hypothetical protein
MAQDPLTGRFLPKGITVRSRIPAELTVRDPGGRFIGGDRHDAIVNAFRDYRSVSATDRTIYDSWRFLMTGKSPGVRDEPPSAGEEDILGRWIHDPTLTGDSSRIARLQQILAFAPVRGGGLVAPEWICTHDLFAIRPLRANRIPSRWHAVSPHLRVEGVGEDLKHSTERLSPWLVGEGIKTVYGRTSLRRVADLQEWRRVCPSLPETTEACAEELLALGRSFGIAPGVTPASMAWRYFRSFLTDRLPPLPVEAMAMCENATAEYVILGPNVRGEATSYIYDLNAAYAHWLRDWPDLSMGRWVPTDRWRGPIGIYHHRTGTIGGQALWEAWDVEPYKTWREEIDGGYVWEGDWNTDSPSQRFVDACLQYTGPADKLARRFPALVVGKSRSAEWCDTILYVRGSYYPAFWANIVGALQARMHTTLRRVRWIAAYIDAVHLRDPLPAEWLGTAPGLWKLIDSGPTNYWSTGNWHSPHEERHQGRKTIETEAS